MRNKQLSIISAQVHRSRSSICFSFGEVIIFSFESKNVCRPPVCVCSKTKKYRHLRNSRRRRMKMNDVDIFDDDELRARRSILAGDVDKPFEIVLR